MQSNISLRRYIQRQQLSPKSTGTRQAPEFSWASLLEKLWHEGNQDLGLESPARASEDAPLFITRRRLPLLQAADHFQYIELVSATSIARLRTLRGGYRRHLHKNTHKPLREIPWQVYRFGIVPVALNLLREAVAEFLADTGVPVGQWVTLFNTGFDFSDLEHPAFDPAAPVQAGPALHASVNALLPDGVFNRGIRGGLSDERSRQTWPGQSLYILRSPV